MRKRMSCFASMVRLVPCLLSGLFACLLSCQHLPSPDSSSVGPPSPLASSSVLSTASSFMPSVSFKGVQIFKKHKNFKGLKLGGLSEIVFDPNSGDFFALSDDKKNHRFYRLKLNCQGSCQFQIQEQILLKSPGQKSLRRSMDPEAIEISNKAEVFIASEGRQMKDKPWEPSQIFTFARDGVLLEAWPVPQLFWDREKSFGPRANKGFESLTLDTQSGLLWTGTEQPLKQDSRALNQLAFIRLSAFSIEDKTLSVQYAYPLSAGGYGLTALEFLQSKVFLSLERAYKKDKKQGVNSIRLFLADCRWADDIKDQPRLSPEMQFKFQKAFHKVLDTTAVKNDKPSSCQKKLLWDSSKHPSVPVDNMEGMTLAHGILPSKDPLLILLSDNNFNEEKQKTIFLFFAFKGR